MYNACDQVIIFPGAQGLPGAQGETGPAGPSGNAAQTLHYIQDSPSDTWVISHDFTFKPGVRVVDSAGDEVFGDVRYPDEHTAIVSFAAPFSGEAYLS